MEQKRVVAVLGASENPERYSNKAVRLLLEKGFSVIPIHPVAEEICGIPVVHRIEDITERVDTLTIYLSPKNSEALIPSIISLHPSRVILNPGAESAKVMDALSREGIPFIEACSLVLLTTGQF